MVPLWFLLERANFAPLQCRNYLTNQYQILNEWSRRRDKERCQIWLRSVRLRITATIWHLLQKKSCKNNVCSFLNAVLTAGFVVVECVFTGWTNEYDNNILIICNIITNKISVAPKSCLTRMVLGHCTSASALNIIINYIYIYIYIYTNAGYTPKSVLSRCRLSDRTSESCLHGRKKASSYTNQVLGLGKTS